jgi:hypothetical protein
MAKIKMKFYLFFLMCIELTAIKAQEAIPATGGNATGSGGSASYSIGQVAYTTNTGTNGTEAQGVQQPFEISVVTGIEEAVGITLQCAVYPNPANDYVTLIVENYKTENLTYQLYDVNGKLLENKKLEGKETNIDLKTLVIASYFLKVNDNKKELKTFKIIKN